MGWFELDPTQIVVSLNATENLNGVWELRASWRPRRDATNTTG